MRDEDSLGWEGRFDTALSVLDLGVLEDLSDKLWLLLPAARPRALSQLLHRVPQSELDRRPRLLLASYQALQLARPREASLSGRLRFYSLRGEQYASAFEAFDAPGDVVAAGMMALLAARARGDYDEAERLGQRLDRRVGLSVDLPPASGDEEAAGLRPGWLAAERGMTAALHGDFDAAMHHLRVAFAQAGPPPAQHFGGVLAAALGAMLAAIRGYSAAAGDWLERVDDAGPLPPRLARSLIAPAAVARAMRAIDQLDRDAAIAHLLEAGEPTSPLEIWPFVAAVWARYERVFGSPTIGLHRLDEAIHQHRALHRTGELAGGIVLRARAELLLEAGEANGVIALADEHAGHSRLAVSLARAYLRSGYPAQAIRYSSRPMRQMGTSPRESLDHHLIVATAQLHRGERADAARVFARAWELYGISGDRSAFLEVDPADLEELCRLGDVANPVAERPLRPRPQTTLIRLSPRERVVLQALSSDETVETIAQRLSVSVNTIRTQTRSIYRKLRVSRREDAVAVAARHSLLDPGWADTRPSLTRSDYDAEMGMTSV